MITFKDSKIVMAKLELGDIINIDILQKFLDNFAVGFNCAAVSVGRNGEEFTKPSHYRPFCSNYIHASSTGDNRCAVCHNEFGQKAIAQGRPYIGQCHAGLIDFAAPVIVNGEHIGTVLGGQILEKPPDEHKIRRVADEIGMDSQGLWEAAQNIDVVPTHTIKAAAEVLYIVVNALAQSGYNSIELNNLASGLANNFIQISSTIEELSTDSQTITASQSELSSEIDQILNNVTEISKVLDSIKRIANQISIIGINASIEAAHIGRAGSGFAVVAEEICNLSNSTKETLSRINKMNETIEKSIGTTKHSANKTLQATSNQAAAMEELSATVTNSVELAENLHNLFAKN